MGEIKCCKCYLTLHVKECELTNSLFYTGCISRLICSSKRSIIIGLNGADYFPESGSANIDASSVYLELRQTEFAG